MGGVRVCGVRVCRVEGGRDERVQGGGWEG